MTRTPNALPIRADARLVAASLHACETTEYRPGPGRSVYLLPSTGRVEVNGVAGGERDGAAIRDEAVLRVTALEAAEILLVDAA